MFLWDWISRTETLFTATQGIDIVQDGGMLNFRPVTAGASSNGIAFQNDLGADQFAMFWNQGTGFLALSNQNLLQQCFSINVLTNAWTHTCNTSFGSGGTDVSRTNPGLAAASLIRLDQLTASPYLALSGSTVTIPAGAIDSTALGVNSVLTTRIQDNAVTQPKIDNDVIDYERMEIIPSLVSFGTINGQGFGADLFTLGAPEGWVSGRLLLAWGIDEVLTGIAQGGGFTAWQRIILQNQYQATALNVAPMVTFGEFGGGTITNLFMNLFWLEA